jgi:hypothetical protein
LWCCRGLPAPACSGGGRACTSSPHRYETQEMPFFVGFPQPASPPKRGLEGGTVCKWEIYIGVFSRIPLRRPLGKRTGGPGWQARPRRPAERVAGPLEGQPVAPGRPAGARRRPARPAGRPDQAVRGRNLLGLLAPRRSARPGCWPWFGHAGALARPLNANTDPLSRFSGICLTCPRRPVRVFHYISDLAGD